MDLLELSCGVSLSAVTSRWSVVVVLLLYSYKPAEGQFQVIGSVQPIMASPGDDVILPCHVEPRVNVVGLTVEWSKSVLEHDPREGQVEYVHLYRHAREDSDMKSLSYFQRTELFTDGLRQGNVSLKITNVTLADKGRYRCNLPKLRGHMQSSVIHLVVEPNSTKASTTEVPPQAVSRQTPGVTKQTDAEGASSSRSRLILCVVACGSAILSVGVGTYLRWRCRKQELMKELVI